MGKIVGIGGVFLNQVEDLKILLKWYDEVLGLDVSEYGINFVYNQSIPLITFDRPKDKPAMLNFHVEDLEDFAEELKAKGVEFVSEIQEESFGKFVQIMDPLGRQIELCELDQEKYREVVVNEVRAYKEQ